MLNAYYSTEKIENSICLFDTTHKKPKTTTKKPAKKGDTYYNFFKT